MLRLMIPVARLFIPLSGFLVVLLIGACGRGEPELVEAEGVVVRDSAGVRIVESADPVWGEGEGWQVAEEPVLRMGDPAEGEGGEEFYFVRYGVWLGPGRFGVTTNRSELRVYDLGGDRLRTLGREGQGPGEFGLMVVLGRTGDRLMLSDGGEGSGPRLTVMDTAGGVLSMAIPSPGAPRGGELLDDSTMVGWRGAFQLAPDDPPVPLDTLVAVDVRTGERRALATSPGVRLAWTELEGRPFYWGSLRFGARSVVAAGHGRAVYGSGDRYELREVDAAGRLTRIVRRIVAARPVTDELKAPAMERWREAGSDPVRRPQFADSVPHFLDLLVDDTDHLWVERRAIDPPGREWDVFDRDRRWLGMVALPEGVDVLAISDTHLLGLTRNELDVEIVEVYEIDKGGG